MRGVAKRTLERAAATYGRDNQLRALQEECGELIVAVNHLARGRKGAEAKLLGEIADVQIMIAQMEIYFCPIQIANRRAEKINRLKSRLDKLDGGSFGRLKA
jgi:NTP pyrophosphatase (non-canonical NTP hydrolase)